MGIAHENTEKYDRLGYDGVEKWRRHQAEPSRLGMCMSYRLLVAITCMMCTLTNFASQATMSSAMVCMVRQDNTSSVMSTELSNYLTQENDTHFYTTERDEPWLFDWTPETQGWILFSFFLSYFFTQIPSGLLVSRFGAKRVLVTGQVCASLSHLITVPATQMGLPFLFLARIMAGASTGCLYSSTFGLIAKWAPRQEISFLYGITGVGIEVGNTFAFGIAMFACELPYQGGWPLVFYSMSACQLLLALFIVWRLTDHPSDNPHITHNEAAYIERNVGGNDKMSSRKIPIRRILTSVPVCASAVCQCGTLLMYYTVITQGPIYLRDVIHLSSFQINLLSAVPFVAVIPLVYVLSSVSDWLIGRGTLSTTALRKLMDGICKLLGIMAVTGLGFVPVNDMTAAFLCYILVALCISVSYASYIPNAGDLSPAHAGFIASIQQTGSLWVSFVLPPVVGAIVQEKTRESWQIVFFTEIVLQALSFLFFLKFGSGQLQPWAIGEEYDVIVASDDLEKAKLVPGHLSENRVVVHNGTEHHGRLWRNVIDNESTALLADTKTSRKTLPRNGVLSV